MLARASDTKQPTSPEYVENPVAVDEALKTTLKSWKKTPEFQELDSILKLVFNAHEVTKVVGIASGSIEFGPESHDDTYRSAVQHSIMITIRDRLEISPTRKSNYALRIPATPPLTPGLLHSMVATSWKTPRLCSKLTTTAFCSLAVQLFH